MWRVEGRRGHWDSCSSLFGFLLPYSHELNKHTCRHNVLRGRRSAAMGRSKDGPNPSTLGVKAQLPFLETVSQRQSTRGE